MFLRATNIQSYMSKKLNIQERALKNYLGNYCHIPWSDSNFAQDIFQMTQMLVYLFRCLGWIPRNRLLKQQPYHPDKFLQHFFKMKNNKEIFCTWILHFRRQQGLMINLTAIWVCWILTILGPGGPSQPLSYAVESTDAEFTTHLKAEDGSCSRHSPKPLWYNIVDRSTSSDWKEEGRENAYNFRLTPALRERQRDIMSLEMKSSKSYQQPRKDIKIIIPSCKIIPLRKPSAALSMGGWELRVSPPLPPRFLPEVILSILPPWPLPSWVKLNPLSLWMRQWVKTGSRSAYLHRPQAEVRIFAHFKMCRTTYLRGGGGE